MVTTKMPHNFMMVMLMCFGGRMSYTDAWSSCACVCVCACVHVCVCDGVLKGKKADSSQIRPLQLRRRKKPRQPSYPLALISTKGKNNKQKVTADNLQHRLEETPYTYFVQAPAGPLPEVG